MDESCHLKLQELGITQKAHSNQLGILFRKQKETDQALADIKQIKYILIGALGYYVISSIGLIEALKLTLG